MKDPTPIDWYAWAAEAPSADFVERVLLATQPGSRAPQFRAFPSRTSPRTIAISAAAAVAALSLAVFAAIQRGERPARTVARTATAGSGSPQIRPADGAAGTARSSTPAASSASRASAPGTVVDRKLRETVRSKLGLPMAAQAVELDPHTGLVIPSHATGPSSRLTRAYLQQRVRQDFIPLAKDCYESALVRLPGLHGKLVVDFMIVGDASVGGIVDQAKLNQASEIDDPEFTTCMLESMLSMVFEPPQNNGWVSVTYPFVFEPTGEKEPPARER